MRTCSTVIFAATLLQLSHACDAGEKPEKLIVATWNLEWFYDHDKSDNQGRLPKELSAPSPEDWDWKLNAVADCIGKMQPTIIALQEVENKRVLEALTARIKARHKTSYQIAFVQGTDRFTEQDVAILYQDSIVSFKRRKQTKQMFDSGKYYNLSKHILATFQWGRGAETESLVIINSHFRAGKDNAKIRQRQARLARYWVKDAIHRGDNVIILGDFNANDSHSQLSPKSTIGILCGLDDDNPKNDLRDLHRFLPRRQRATHLTGKQFDRILVSSALMTDSPDKKDYVFSKIRRPQHLVVQGAVDRDHRDGYYKIPAAERDASDHYPLVAEFQLR